MPKAESTVFERRLIFSRNQGLQTPLRHEPTTWALPKALMVAQTMPAAPWFPKIIVSADAGPTSVVSMAGSTNPLPRLETSES